MSDAKRQLADVLREAIVWLRRPDNNFDRSSWNGAEEAVSELSAHVAALDAGKLPPKLDLTVLFAPTGPIQEVSLSSGWGEEFLLLAQRFDHAVTSVEYEPPTPRPPAGEIVTRNLPLACWGIALALCLGMVFEVFGSVRGTSGSNRPQVDVLNLAWGTVALRSAFGLARRERTWWSLAYIALVFVLPFVADAATKWWRASS